MEDREETQELVERQAMPELVSVNAIEQMERAAIDIQIATAKRYPRSLTEFLKSAKDMVSVDEQTAESCIYRRPVGKEGGRQVYAEGESIRMAEIVAACYGNFRASGKIIEITDRQVKAIGMAFDVEKNVAFQSEAIESTVDRNGRPYSERQRLLMAKVAQSKAIRDAIFKVVPKSLVKPMMELARQVISGQDKPLAIRRQQAMAWVGKLALDKERVFSALGIKGVEELGNEQLETLTGIRTAIKDGDCTIEDAFPKLGPEAETKTGVEGLKERLKNGAQKNAAPATESPKTAGNGADPEKDAQDSADLAELNTFSKPPAEKPAETAQAAPESTEVPANERFYCKNCDKTSGSLKGAKKNLCPSCLSDKVIDRWSKKESQ
jgi:hypothetical protein